MISSSPAKTFEPQTPQFFQELSETVLDTVDALVVVLDAHGRIVRFNKACETMTGYSCQEVIGLHFWQYFILPDDIPFFQTLFRYIDSFPFLHKKENIWLTKEGKQELISWSNAALRDENGKIQFVLGTGIRITEQKTAEAALQKAEQHYRSIFENALEGIFQTTPEGRYLSVNPALARIYGYPSTEMLVHGLYDITRQLYVNPERRAEFSRLMQEQGTVSDFEAQIFRKDSSIIWITENAREVRDTDGHLLFYEGTVQDITERKSLEAERERLLEEALEHADHDPLTGLLNHRAFHKRFREEAARADRDGTPLAVAVLDLDNFKFFNDAYGHAAGDGVLRRVAEALCADCRSYDILSRFGGDEFALLMPGTTSEMANTLLGRLKNSLGTIGYQPIGSETAIPLTLSVGLAFYPEEGLERQSVLEIADARLLRTKTGGSEDESIENLRAMLTGSFQGFSMLDALVTAVDNKDRYTRRHSEDVMRHALLIASKLGLSAAVLKTIQIAALLHDVGKIGVPDRILRKPSSLTPDEFEAVQQHPMMGAVIVGAVPGFEETLDAIRHHHERWDGQGYPFGLSERDIPQLARIMAVADAFSAMTMDRPYRKGKRTEEALAILTAGAGSQWDPACVDAFQRGINARLRSETRLCSAA
jgi:diguanylate cyclase (GGDEF)-like protein/PAS domain S-box-containing protein